MFARYVLPAGETAASEKAEVEGENWAETRLVTPRSLADRFRARVEYFPAATEVKIKSGLIDGAFVCQTFHLENKDKIRLAER